MIQHSLAPEVKKTAYDGPTNKMGARKNENGTELVPSSDLRNSSSALELRHQERDGNHSTGKDSVDRDITCSRRLEFDDEEAEEFSEYVTKEKQAKKDTAQGSPSSLKKAAAAQFITKVLHIPLDGKESGENGVQEENRESKSYYSKRKPKSKEIRKKHMAICKQQSF